MECSYVVCPHPKCHTSDIGNGEIDFNEFLNLMTSTEQYLETIRGELDKAKLCWCLDCEISNLLVQAENSITCVYITLPGVPRDSQKENLFFTALTKFMKKSALSSLSEIERYMCMYVIIS